MKKWALRFFLLGLAIATALSLLFMLDHKHVVNLGMQNSIFWSQFFLLFWPSSIMLIGVGEAPGSTWLSIMSNYAIVIVINGLMYAILGCCIGFLLRRLSSKPTSQQ